MNKNKNIRGIDKTVGEISSWWEKSLVYATKKQITSWKALFVILFAAGTVAGIIWTVSMNIETNSKAAGSATLTWAANSEPDLAGYKVYYGTSPRTSACPMGGYANAVDAGKTTSYVFNGLTAGQTYYFSVTAYDTSHNESCFSGEVKKVIPMPQTAACTGWTYSAWGTCQANGTQTRTVTSSSPTGCTGGSPVLTQTCAYVPPVSATCTSFTYSAWGTCQSNGTQTRTVTASSPTGCAGGSPALSQTCTYAPPASGERKTCTSFTYSAWGTCQANGTQTRTVTTGSPTGCTGGSPALSQTCTNTPPASGERKTCTSFTYSSWSACVSGTRTRTVKSRGPEGCTGGTPVVKQTCTGERK